MLMINRNKKKEKKWGDPGIEPGTSPTQTKNHTSRPIALFAMYYKLSLPLTVLTTTITLPPINNTPITLPYKSGYGDAAGAGSRSDGRRDR